MSKVDDILEDELDPEDLDPTPRGGQNGRNTESGPAKFVRGLGERIGIAGIVAFTAVAALLGTAGCREGSGPQTATSPTCDEPASWCQR